MFKASTLFFVLFLPVVVEINLMLERNSRDILTLRTLVYEVIAKCRTPKINLVCHCLWHYDNHLGIVSMLENSISDQSPCALQQKMTK